jgi:hypothetical protein
MALKCTDFHKTQKAQIFEDILCTERYLDRQKNAENSHKI